MQYAIEIRCVRLDGPHNYDTTWPDLGELRINEKKILDFKPLAKNSSLKKRKDCSFLTNDFSLIRKGTNTVSLRILQG